MSFLFINPIFSIVYFGVISVPLLISITLIWFGRSDIGLPLLILILVLIYIMIRVLLLKRVIINESGVIFKTPSSQKQILWSDMKCIGVPRIRSRAGNRWIYFTSQEMHPVLYVDASMINNDFFVVSYRKSIIKAITTYWRSGITRV